MSELQTLKALLDNANSNASKMLLKVQRFEDRLGIVDSYMRPIQDTTNTYSRAKKNISDTIGEIQKTYEYFRISSEVDGIVNAGLVAFPHSDFFDAIGKLTNAKTFFELHKKDIKAASAALVGIDNLLKKGIGKLNDAYEKLLKQVGPTVSMDDDTHVFVGQIVMTSEVIDEMKQLAATLENNNIHNHYKLYESIRIDEIKATMAAFEQAHSSEWSKLLQDVPYQKGSHPLQGYEQLAAELLRSELELLHLLLPVNDVSLNIFSAICDAVTTELSRIISPLLTLKSFDYKLPNIMLRQSNLFLIRMDMLEIFVNHYDDLNYLCHSEYNSRSASKSIGRLDDLKSKIVDACIDIIDHLLITASGTSTTTFSSSFMQTEDNTCDLSPITGNVLYCCKELIGFATTYAKVYELAVQLKKKIPLDLESLPVLISKLISNVIGNIQAKADAFNTNAGSSKGGVASSAMIDSHRRSVNLQKHNLYDTGVIEAKEIIVGCKKHLYLINNMYSISVYLREKRKEVKTSGTDKANKAAPGGINNLATVEALLVRVDSLLTESETLFCVTVAQAMGISSEDIKELHEQYSKDKNARLLKAKFSSFNSGVAALQDYHGEWRVSAAALREMLTSKLSDSLMIPYTDLYSTYGSIQFSKKHMKQYICYTPQEFQVILKTFFGNKNA